MALLIMASLNSSLIGGLFCPKDSGRTKIYSRPGRNRQECRDAPFTGTQVSNLREPIALPFLSSAAYKSRPIAAQVGHLRSCLHADSQLARYSTAIPPALSRARFS